MMSRLIPATAAVLVLLGAPAATYSKDHGDEPPGQSQGQGQRSAEHGPPPREESEPSKAQASQEQSSARKQEPSSEPTPEPTASSASTSGQGSSSDQQGTRDGRTRSDTTHRNEASTKKDPVATPAPATPSQPAPAPAAAAAPVAPAQPAPVTRPRSGRGASSSTTSSGGTSRANRRSGAPLAGTFPGATTAQAPSASENVARRPARPEPRLEPLHESSGAVERGSGSGIGRRVTQLVEVIPDWLVSALALLGVLTLGFGFVAIVNALRARRLEETRMRLAADVSLLQSALIPALPDQIGSALVSVAYEPTEGPAAGGDFYDVFPLADGRTGVIVGDVEGHGRLALPLTSRVRHTVRSHLEGGAQPRQALQAADEVLLEQLTGKLVTVVAAVYDPLAGQLTYACAGHPPPIFIGIDQPPVGAATSPPIGSGSGTGRRQVTVALPPAAAACFITDGLAEVRLDAHSRLGYDGLEDTLSELGPDCSAEDIISVLLERHGQTDDMTACVLRPMSGAPVPHPECIEELEVSGADLLTARRFLAEHAANGEAEAALQEVRRIIVESGAAVLEAHRTADGDIVAVRPPTARTAA